MAYDEILADRVSRLLARRKGISQRKMFGGITFLRNGHMCCGVVGRDLVVRLGEAGVDDALEGRHTRPMDFTGRPLKSMVYLSPSGCRSDKELKGWLDRAIRFVEALPPKPVT